MGNTDLHRRLALRWADCTLHHRPPHEQGRFRHLYRNPARADPAASDIVILDNLAVHKSARAAECLKKVGAWFRFLPAYSPDLNPIEMAFAKLKAHLRAANARTFDTLVTALGDICRLFNPVECWNYLKAAGYASD